MYQYEWDDPFDTHDEDALTYELQQEYEEQHYARYLDWVTEQEETSDRDLDSP